MEHADGHGLSQTGTGEGRGGADVPSQGRCPCETASLQIREVKQQPVWLRGKGRSLSAEQAASKGLELGSSLELSRN